LQSDETKKFRDIPHLDRFNSWSSWYDHFIRSRTNNTINFL